MERKIDINTWPRKGQYNLFRQMDYPHFNVCAQLDITNFYTFVKAKNISFYTAMIYITTKIANEIKEFRYRIRGQEVVEHERIHPSFTILSKPEVFSFCSVEFYQDYHDFSQNAEEKRKDLQGHVNLDDEPGRDDSIYITSLPWVSFTSVSHPVHLKSVDSIPRIAWGKYEKERERVKMPFSVQVNHALMDGYHVGRYFEMMQEALDRPEEHIEL